MVRATLSLLSIPVDLSPTIADYAREGTFDPTFSGRPDLWQSTTVRIMRALLSHARQLDHKHSKHVLRRYAANDDTMITTRAETLAAGGFLVVSAPSEQTASVLFFMVHMIVDNQPDLLHTTLQYRLDYPTTGDDPDWHRAYRDKKLTVAHIYDTIRDFHHVKLLSASPERRLRLLDADGNEQSVADCQYSDLELWDSARVHEWLKSNLSALF